MQKGSEGVDVAFIKEYTPMYMEAAKLTIGIALIGIVLSLMIGLVCSMVLYYKIPIFRKIVTVYIELSRNTPLLVQLFLLYFGLPKAGIKLESVTCAVIGLSFLGGRIDIRIVRSGLESVEKNQLESGLSIGLSRRQIMSSIIFPQALSVSIPALCANIIFLIKETSVFSVVALADLMYVAKDLIGLYYDTNEALFMLVVAYLILLLPISVIAWVLERRLRYAGFGS